MSLPATQNPNPTTPETGAGGTGAVETIEKDWREEVPKENRFNAQGKDRLEKFKGKTQAEIAASYLELETYSGGAVKIPGPDASKEEWEKFHAKMRPETPDGYEIAPLPLEKFQEMFPGITPGPEDTERALELMGEWKKFAHEHGYTPKQAQAAYDFHVQMEHKKFQQFQAQLKATDEQLKRDWGVDYEKNFAVAVKGMEDEGSPEMKELINQRGLTNHPVVIKHFYNLGQKNQEHSFVRGGPSSKGVMTAEGAKAEIAKIMNTPEDLYNKSGINGHKERVAEMQKLYQIAYPEPEVV